MTAEVNCVFSKVVNTCLSFLNEVKNPSRKYRYYMLFLNEPNRKINEWLWQKSRHRLSGKVAAEPSEGVSVSKQVKWFWPMYALLPLSPRRLGTSLRIRGKRTTKEERILILYLYMLLTISAAGFFAAHNNLFFIIHFFMYACHRSRMTAEVNCVFSKVVNTCLSFLNEVKNPSRKYRYYMLFLNEPNRKIKEWLWQKSRPRLSGKVAAEPSEGASVSRNENADKIWKNRVDRSEIKW